MKRRFSWLALVVATALIVSSCTVGRMVVYQFSDIKDYKRFPSRSLPASDAPFHFQTGDTTSFKQLGITFSREGEQYDLDRWNDAHESVAFLVIQHDSILYERYFDGYDESSWVASFSMAKSYVSALVGIAVEEGHIKSVNDPITDYIPEMEKNGLSDITVRHVLQMTTGIQHAENYFNPFAGVSKSYYGKRLSRQVEKLKQQYEAGVKFHYQSINTQVLGEILVRATGRTLTDYMQQKLWGPLQMEYPASWSIDQKKNGMEKAFCCINAVARDFAKFGRLYLREGDWDGKQVVPQEWVRESTKIDAKNGAWGGYQYQWWLRSKEGDYAAEGHLGQFIYVHPTKDLVIVRLGKKYGGVKWAETFREIAALL